MGTPINHGPKNDRNIIADMTYDKGGRITSLRDPRGNLTTFTYDKLDRRRSVTNPLNQTWTTDYEDLPNVGSRITATDPNGHSTVRELDLLGRLQTLRYGDPSSTPDVRFSYDVGGKLTRMTEYGGPGFTDPLRSTIYSYDAARRLVSVGYDEDGDGVVEQTVRYEYDAGGRRTKLRLPDGKALSYQYNERGELVTIRDWDDQETRYAYDGAGRLIAAERTNGLRSRYRYDAAGRLKGVRHSAGNKTLAHFAYEVDKRGNRVQALEALPHPNTTDDTVIGYNDRSLTKRGTWTDADGFKGTTHKAGTLRMAFLGEEVTLTVGTGPDHSIFDVYIGYSLWQSFDGYATAPGEREIAITLHGEGPHVLELRNRADKNRQSNGYQLRFKQLVVPNRSYALHSMAYEYDALSRLLDAKYAPGLNANAADVDLLRRYEYSYDVAGNRLSETLTVNGGSPATASYSYNAANQISNSGFVYDANGNLTDDGTNSYTWDRANRLTSMGGLSYSYDGAGNRIQQSNGVDVTKYLLDNQPGLSVVLGATTGADTTRYVHGPRGIHAQQNPTGDWQWLAQDGLGSVRGVTDDALTLQEIRQYAPYGEPFDGVGTNRTVYGFTGEPTDITELVYLRARYLNPVLGVFASRDPFEGMTQRPMSLNGYSWVEGNVPNRVDPSGVVPLDIWISAFIEPATIVFPYPYQDSLGIDTNAIWHGDARTWYSGGTKPSARVWFSIQADTNDLNSVTWDRDTGYTEVTYVDPSGASRTSRGQAAKPDDNAVRVVEGFWSQAYGGYQINVKASAGNPLVFPGLPFDFAFAIDFAYAINIYPCLQRIDVYAWHDVFPWHEVYMQLDGRELLYIRDVPSEGIPFVLGTPAALVFPAISPTLTIAYDARLEEGANCKSRDSLSKRISDLIPRNIDTGCVTF